MQVLFISTDAHMYKQLFLVLFYTCTVGLAALAERQHGKGNIGNITITSASF